MEPSKNNGQSLGKGKGREELGAEFYMGTVGSQQHRKPHTCSIKGFALRNSIFFFFFLSLCSSSGLAISNTQIWCSGGAEVPAAAFSSGKHSFQARVTTLEKRCRSRASPLPPLFPPAGLRAGAGGGWNSSFHPSPSPRSSPGCWVCRGGVGDPRGRPPKAGRTAGASHRGRQPRARPRSRRRPQTARRGWLPGSGWVAGGRRRPEPQGWWGGSAATPPGGWETFRWLCCPLCRAGAWGVQTGGRGG